MRGKSEINCKNGKGIQFCTKNNYFMEKETARGTYLSRLRKRKQEYANKIAHYVWNIENEILNIIEML